MHENWLISYFKSRRLVDPKWCQVERMKWHESKALIFDDSPCNESAPRWNQSTLALRWADEKQKHNNKWMRKLKMAGLGQREREEEGETEATTIKKTLRVIVNNNNKKQETLWTLRTTQTPAAQKRRLRSNRGKQGGCLGLPWRARSMSDPQKRNKWRQNSEHINTENLTDVMDAVQLGTSHLSAWNFDGVGAPYAASQPPNGRAG